LKALYPEIDFTTYCFTRHLLGALQAHSEERFRIVSTELQAAWTARMTRFLAKIDTPVLLVSVGDLPAVTDIALDRPAPFVTRDMVAGLGLPSQARLVYRPSANALAVGTAELIGEDTDRGLAVMNAAMHEELARALTDRILEI
jgi:hypothetical protein